jgi:hypothetical protein
MQALWLGKVKVILDGGISQAMIQTTRACAQGRDGLLVPLVMQEFHAPRRTVHENGVLLRAKLRTFLLRQSMLCQEGAKNKW